MPRLQFLLPYLFELLMGVNLLLTTVAAIHHTYDQTILHLLLFFLGMLGQWTSRLEI